ncbi:MAG: oligoribonuclease [Candidatus Dojkabacteria bacterium]|nr:MAG: oligoribonuclease [Candidatus Dojkabacteria bacterium]
MTIDPLAPLVWLDLEMTGLDIQKDTILEAALIITNSNLEIMNTPLTLTIHVSDEVLNNMNDWSKEHHAASGLISRVKQSPLTHARASEILLDEIKKYTKPNTSFLAGNSVHNDRRFLEKEMPQIVQYLHYKVLDVSSLEIIQKYWFPEVEEFKKLDLHRAKSDITESIAELKYYREHILRNTSK